MQFLKMLLSNVPIHPSETKATANSFLCRWHKFAALALVREQKKRALKGENERAIGRESKGKK